MKYCKHLKKRKNKPYCNLLKQEITFSQCRECDKKEYKINNKKFTIFVKNDTFCTKNAKNNKKIVRNLKNKSKKLANLERKRKSVFTDDLEHCYLCGRPKEHMHEIIYGKNRLNSIKYNFVIPLCANHHTGKDGIHFNKELDLYYKRLCQIYFENNLGDRTDFIKIFGRSYLQ